MLLGDGDEVSGNARCGDDILIGGAGNDQLYGDHIENVNTDLTNVKRGTDCFVFAQGSGLDTIVDFEDGRDVIDVSSFAGIDNFADVGSQAAQVGSDVVIDLGAAAGGASGVDALELAGFSLGALNATDFVFG